jgi:hypothetical protein
MAEENEAGTTRPCPHCSKPVHPECQTCPHCHKVIRPADEKASPPKQEDDGDWIDRMLPTYD